jgi:hypothetical protein
MTMKRMGDLRWVKSDAPDGDSSHLATPQPERPSDLLLPHARHSSTGFRSWYIYDGTWGPFDNRTFVLRSDNPLGFNSARQVAAFNAHAPEIVHEDDGRWFVTSAEWPERGLSIAELVWE